MKRTEEGPIAHLGGGKRKQRGTFHKTRVEEKKGRCLEMVETGGGKKGRMDMRGQKTSSTTIKGGSGN